MWSLSYRLLALWFIWVLCRLCPMPALLTSCLWCSSWVGPTVKPGDEVQNEITKYSALAHCGNRPITNYIIVIFKTGRNFGCQLRVAHPLAFTVGGSRVRVLGHPTQMLTTSISHTSAERVYRRPGKGKHKILATATHIKV